LKDPENATVVTTVDAAEIIDEIQRLPDTEQGKVVELVRHLPNAKTIAEIHEPLEKDVHSRALPSFLQPQPTGA